MAITLIPINTLDLCKHIQILTQKFPRKVMLAFPELKEDMTGLRLQDGWNRRLARDGQKSRIGNKTVHVNQKGLVKINGR